MKKLVELAVIISLGALIVGCNNAPVWSPAAPVVKKTALTTVPEKQAKVAPKVQAIPKIKKTTLKVIVSPAGAKISLGDNKPHPVGKAFEIKPGSYEIWAFRVDYEVFKKTYKIVKGKDNVIKIRLKKETGYIPPEGAPS